MIWGYPYFWKHPYVSTQWSRGFPLCPDDFHVDSGLSWWNLLRFHRVGDSIFMRKISTWHSALWGEEICNVDLSPETMKIRFNMDEEEAQKKTTCTGMKTEWWHCRIDISTIFSGKLWVTHGVFSLNDILGTFPVKVNLYSMGTPFRTKCSIQEIEVSGFDLLNYWNVTCYD